MLCFSCLVFILVTACSTTIVATAGAPLHIGVISIPLYGHFLPLKAVSEQLLVRGHSVTIFTEHESWCDTVLAHTRGKSYGFQCEVMPKSETFSQDLFKNLSLNNDIGATFVSTFEEMTKHQREQLPVYIKRMEDLFAHAPEGGKETATNQTVAHAHQQKKNQNPFDLILTDLSTFVGFDVARKFSIPTVAMFPLVLHMVAGPSTWLPSLGTGFPKELSFSQRLINYLIKMLVPLHGLWMLDRLNEVRAHHHVAPYADMVEVAAMRSPILAPSIWGYDIPQPLCPNIFPLGVVSPLHGHVAPEPKLKRFLSSKECERGVIYVNFGTLAFVSDRLFAVLARELVIAAPKHLREYCIVWKVTETDRRQMFYQAFQDNFQREDKNKKGSSNAWWVKLLGMSKKETDPSSGSEHEKGSNQLGEYETIMNDRVYIARRFADPPWIMAHERMKLFITHCGDTSLGEAVTAGLPLAGIPMFVDQIDVCQRLQERGIGIHIGHKKDVDDVMLVAALEKILSPNGQLAARKALAEVKQTADWLGGPARGATLVEHFARNKGSADLLPCVHANLPLGMSSSWFLSRRVWQLIYLQSYDLIFFTQFIPLVVVLVLVSKIVRKTKRLVAS